MTVLRYTLLRLLLLAGSLLGLWLVGVRDPVWLIASTAVLSMALSFFLLRGPRAQMAQQLADRVAGRLPAEGSRDRDGADEDGEIDATEQPDPRQVLPGQVLSDSERETQQDAVDQFGASGGRQHGDERQPPGA